MTTLGPGRKALNFLAFFTLAACAPPQTIVIIKEVDPLPKGREKAVCSTIQSYSSSITIDGYAKYEKYAYDSTTGGLSSSSLTDSGNPPKPIRYAEVEVKDAAGNRIQCGETDGTGYYSVNVPVDASATYYLHINSRGDNSFVKASVQNDPDNYQYYSVRRGFTPDVTKTLPDTVAEATNTVVGGAFNIFDNIVRANERRRRGVDLSLVAHLFLWHRKSMRIG